MRDVDIDSSQYVVTDAFHHTAPAACQFSPGTTFFAVVLEDHIVVRVTETLQLVRTWACQLEPDPNRGPAKPDVKQLAWSPDSSFLLACAPRSGATWIFGLADTTEAPRAFIHAGIEGLTRSEWSPDSTAVLCFSEQHLRLTIHKLTGGAATYIENFKAPYGCHSYRHDKKYLAIAEQHKGRDILAIYDSGDMYNMIRSFPLATQDVRGVSWSPCGRWISVWDQHLDYAVYVYSPLGPLLSTFTPSSPSFIGPDPGLGVRMVSWGPGGNWLGIGGFDGKIRIIEANGWRCMSTLDPLLLKSDQKTSVWKEPTDWYPSVATDGMILLTKMDGMVLQNSGSTGSMQNKEQQGITHLEWNADGTCLLTRTDALSNMLYIFSFLAHPSASRPEALTLQTVLWLSDSVKHAQWNPSRSPNLALITLPSEGDSRRSGSGVYVWEGDWEEERQDLSNSSLRGGGSAAIVAMNMSSFETHDIRWSPDGENLCVIDKNKFCIVREVIAAGQETCGLALSVIEE